MATKHKKQIQAKPSQPDGGARREVERLIEKGRLKDAVKEAKLYHRQTNTPESHHLLERAYHLRAEQLHREGMPNSAREVAQHLLDFGLTDADLVEPFARLLVAVGMAQEALALQGRM